ncbi:MAG TPA: response regulator transcription factor [Bacteriovoracaceae bacterium]|nr:response regulator transcription factor [Bacteriovoracaceae bacterium]
MSELSLLIVEDEPNLGQTLRDYLRAKKFAVELATSCEEARYKFIELPPAIVILDIGLPDGSGIDLAREFRAARKDCVLLFCTALNDPALRVEGLELGAEDYITKPFELKELTLRLDRILRSRQVTLHNPDTYSFGKLVFWPKRFEIRDANGAVSSLGQKECAILELLIDRKNEVVARDEMIESIWGENSFPTNRTIDNYIVRIRKWADSDLASELTITSVRGIGYKLEWKGN